MESAIIAALLGLALGRLTGYAASGLASLLVLGSSGYGWMQYRNLSDGITKSDVLNSVPTPKAASSKPKPPTGSPAAACR
jgi:hypothetical protein